MVLVLKIVCSSFTLAQGINGHFNNTVTLLGLMYLIQLFHSNISIRPPEQLSSRTSFQLEDGVLDIQ